MRFGFAGREFYLTSALTLAYLRLCIFRSHFREFKSQRADERRGSPPAKTAITRVAKVASDRETASSLQKAKIHRKATKMTRTKLNTISTNRECTGNARLPPPPFPRYSREHLAQRSTTSSKFNLHIHDNSFVPHGTT